MTSEEIMNNLRQPFESGDVKWRVQQSGIMKNDNPYLMMIPYIDNRAIQNRLDEIFGFDWQNVTKEVDGGFMTGLSIKIGEKWITRWDGASTTGIEPIKGGISDSMKRAAVQFGIGRYLYGLEPVFAECWWIEGRRDALNATQIKEKKQGQQYPIKRWVGYNMPELPTWALPHTDYSPFINAIKDAADMDALKDAFTEAYKASKASSDDRLESQAVDAKDKRKKEIQKQIDKEISEEFQVVKKWLDAEIKKFTEHNITKTLTDFSVSVKENLDNKVKGARFDPKPLYILLESGLKMQIEKIKQPRKGK